MYVDVAIVDIHSTKDPTPAIASFTECTLVRLQTSVLLRSIYSQRWVSKLRSSLLQNECIQYTEVTSRTAPCATPSMPPTPHHAAHLRSITYWGVQSQIVINSRSSPSLSSASQSPMGPTYYRSRAPSHLLLRLPSSCPNPCYPCPYLCSCHRDLDLASYPNRLFHHPQCPYRCYSDLAHPYQ